MNSVIIKEGSPLLDTIMQKIRERIGTGKIMSHFEDDKAEFFLRWEGRSVNNELLRFERKWSYYTLMRMHNPLLMEDEFVETFNALMKEKGFELFRETRPADSGDAKTDR